MNGRRIYHARGKVLGGSSSINGMIFQRGNPLDYERWAADKGMEAWDYLHCLPYFKRMETLLSPAASGRRLARRQRPARARARPGDQPAVRRVLRGRAAGRLPADRRRQRLPPGGLRPLRPQRAPTVAGSRAARAYLHPVMDRPNLRVETLAMATKVDLRRQARRPASTTCAAAARTARSRPARSILCGGAINTPQLLQLSGVGNPEHLAAARRRMVARPARRRREPPGPPRGLHPVRLQAAGLDRARPGLAPPARHRLPSGCSSASGLGATNHFEGGGFARSNDDVDYPNLMFHFLPIADPLRRHPRPTEGHGYQVHIGPMYADTRGCVKIATTDPKQHPAMLFNYLSTPNDRREWVEAIRVARDILNQPAFAPFNDGELSPGPVGRDRRGDPRLGRARTPRPRCTRRARRRWASTTCR